MIPWQERYGKILDLQDIDLGVWMARSNDLRELDYPGYMWGIFMLY
jgi:hypothetical protein